MLELMSLPLMRRTLDEYGGAAALEREARALGCGGLELLWGGEDFPDEIPCQGSVGYHLLFYPDWLDLWRGDEARLNAKFGGEEVWRAFYGGGRESLIAQYEADMERAAALGARYAVFHVSDVSIDEGYTYRWEHDDLSVIDAAAELINILTEKKRPPFPLLVENQWWPGFTFTEPKLTRRLLDAIETPDKGIMLDTGHLMNANRTLTTQAEGVSFIHAMLDAHGDLADYIRGIHLHQSLSGEYVRTHTGTLPAELSEDYLTRYGQSYSHVLKIDRHLPWTDPAICGVVSRVSPEFLTHELSAPNRTERAQAVRIQRETLARGKTGESV